MNGKAIMRFKNVYIPVVRTLSYFFEYPYKDLIYADASVQWHNLPIELILAHEQMHIDFKEYCKSKGIKSIPNKLVNTVALENHIKDLILSNPFIR